MKVETDVIEDRQLLWYGHVRRAENSWKDKITA